MPRTTWTPCAHLSKKDGRVGSPLKFIQKWKEMFAIHGQSGSMTDAESIWMIMMSFNCHVKTNLGIIFFLFKRSFELRFVLIFQTLQLDSVLLDKQNYHYGIENQTDLYSWKKLYSCLIAIMQTC